MRTKAWRSGFTLPEILVTVTVIAVLAAVVVPAVTQFATKGDAPTTKEEVGSLIGSVSNFTTDIRKYPGTMQELVTAITLTPATVDGTGANFAATDTVKWKGPYSAAILSSAASTAVYTTGGIPMQLGPAFTITSSLPKWLQTPIVTINGVAPDCPGIIAVDAAVDGANFAGSESSTGQVQWTTGSGTCTKATQTGTSISAAFLRLIPSP